MATAISKKIYSQHVADKNKEVIEIIVHSALNVPPSRANRVQKCFTTCQSLVSLEQGNELESLSSKPNTTQPILSTNPEWNDIIFCETLEENAPNDYLMLFLIEDDKQDQIAEFKLKWNNLKPFYQYNLMLCLNEKQKGKDDGLKLFVSLTRKQSYLSKREMPLYGLEVFMNKIEETLAEKTALYAVARIVPNYQNYLDNYLKNGEAEVDFLRVKFPLTLAMEKQFTKPRDFNTQGYPQIVMATLKDSTPSWQQNFLFASTDENDALFKRDTALFIEFFPYEKIENNKTNFKIKNLVGWCSIRLDQRFKTSYSDAEFGVRPDSLLVETDGSLTTQKSEKLSASIGLKIIRNKCPKKMSFDLSILPWLESHFTEENVHMSIDPVYFQKKGYKKKLNVLIDEDERSSEVDGTVVQKKTEEKASRDNGDFTKFLTMSGTKVGNKNVTHVARGLDNHMLLQRADDFNDIPIDYRYALLNLNTPKDDDLETWVKYYKNLSHLYRSMVKEMDAEILAYRHQIKNLKNELASKFIRFDEKKAALLKLAEINEVDRANLNKAFLELKTRLAIKNGENQTLRDQVKVLERKLERKINTDRELEKMVTAQTDQNRQLHLMQHRLDEAYGLEDTVRKQDKIISKLEEFIHKLVNEEKIKNAEYYDYLRTHAPTNASFNQPNY